ncbi:hypothetical protein PF049_02635 [Erythrobacteraceae bacterium WH01K]|nr:hypothetical protein PF049_02635 [Erythrobacteraceae bacterium WH01K]
MKQILATAVALGLGMVAMPAAADHHMSGSDIMLNADQKSMMESWPADRKATYSAWPAEAQAYYWTLSPEQQQGWWMLDNPQRVSIVGMNAQDQATTWRTISQQVLNRAGPTASSATSSMSNGNIRFVSEPMIQRIPAPHNGAYPLCTNGRTDNCINPREAR